MRKGELPAKIRKEFETNSNRVLYVSDLAVKFNVLITQVQATVLRLQKQNMPIETVLRGQAWKFVPSGDKSMAATEKKSSAEPKMYRELGSTKSGKTLVIDDAEGIVYRLEEIL
jgi:hypothetical protein